MFIKPLRDAMRGSSGKRVVTHPNSVSRKPLPRKPLSRFDVNIRSPSHCNNSKEGITVAQATLLEMDTAMDGRTDAATFGEEPALLASQVSIEEAEDVAFDIPESYAEKVKWVVSQMRTTFQLALVRFIKPDQEISQELEVKLVLFLRALNVIEYTKTLEDAARLQYKFKHVLDNRDTKYQAFPEKYIERVRALMEKWKEQGFALEEEVEEEEGEEVAVQPGSSGAVVRSRPIKVAKDGDAPVIRRPHPNHPIYGRTGIMRGILVARGATRAYRLDDEWPKIPAKVFGANGLHVGDWWPLQIAALRDGAHGARIGGIYGDQNQGAYSIVVSKAYGTLDEDEGDILYYSGSGSHENTSNVPNETRATRCLVAALTTRKPVRVLRAASGHAFAPSIGIRYDGLYEVVTNRISTNGVGGAYHQFKLVRLEGQHPINIARPTRQEERLADRVSLGY